MKRRSHSALLIVDFINPTLSSGAFALRALKAARATARLKREAKQSGLPVIYANDHFGNWQADLPHLIEQCRRRKGCGSEILKVLEPEREDFTILKPRHSAFYGTPLDFLLDELATKKLIIAGIETDICVLFAAQDAHMRRLKLWIPRNCVASRSASRHEAALAFMKTNLDARVERA